MAAISGEREAFGNHIVGDGQGASAGIVHQRASGGRQGHSRCVLGEGVAFTGDAEPGRDGKFPAVVRAGGNAVAGIAGEGHRHLAIGAGAFRHVIAGDGDRFHGLGSEESHCAAGDIFGHGRGAGGDGIVDCRLSLVVAEAADLDAEGVGICGYGLVGYAEIGLGVDEVDTARNGSPEVVEGLIPQIDPQGSGIGIGSRLAVRPAGDVDGGIAAANEFAADYARILPINIDGARVGACIVHNDIDTKDGVVAVLAQGDGDVPGAIVSGSHRDDLHYGWRLHGYVPGQGRARAQPPGVGCRGDAGQGAVALVQQGEGKGDVIG